MNRFKIIGKFKCCGRTMISVKMKSAVCVMSESDFTRIVKAEKWNNKNKAA